MQDILIPGILRITTNTTQSPEDNAKQQLENPTDMVLCLKIPTIKILLSKSTTTTRAENNDMNLILQTTLNMRLRLLGLKQRYSIALGDFKMYKVVQDEEVPNIRPINVAFNYFWSPQRANISLDMPALNLILSYDVINF